MRKKSGSEQDGAGTKADLAAGLVGHWPMEQVLEPTPGQKTATPDIAGGKHGRFEHGTPELVPGRVGRNALRFFESCYLNCGHAAALDVTEAITFAAWLKKDKDGRKGRIASRHGYLDDQNGGWLVLYGPNDTNIEWRLSRDGTADWTGGYTSKGSFPYDQWHHLAVTYDGSTMRAYVDGREDAGGNFPCAASGRIHLSKAELLIGQDRAHGEAFGGAKTWSWTGCMDDVRLYNRALSQADIAALFEIGNRKGA